MNNRFTLQDLAGILATQTGRTKKDSEEFLKEFIRVVSDRTFTDRLVKVKGLGTFKIIEVEDRESINVNTGQRFIIPGHYKFNFTPDKDLKELVNKPFSFFDTTEIYTEGRLQELTATTEEVIEAVEEEEAEAEVEATVTETVEEEAEAEVETVEEEAEVEATVTDLITQREEKREKAGTVRQKKNKLLLIIILVLSVVALGVFAYFFLNSAERDPKASSGQIESAIKDSVQNTQDTQDTQDVTEEPDMTAIESSEPDQTLLPEDSSSKVLAHVTIEPGSRLTLVSLEYYQHKIFWVYIYEYNKELIEDPNNIPIGTKLAIPAPEMYGINANDRESIEKASSLQTQIIAGEK